MTGRGIAALTIFLGAFLTFLIEPLVGNTLLPVFGGTAATWSACLAVFQALLVGGYLYAHRAGTRIRTNRRSVWVHVFLLLLAPAWIAGISVDAHRAVAWAGRIPVPAVGAVLAVLVLVAVPFVLLASNSSLIQLLSGGRYKLYAVSNFGSLVGLLAYPFAFERLMPLSQQWRWIAGLMLAYAALFALCARTAPADGADARSGASVHCPGAASSVHFLLSFASCFLLNAVTVHVCSDITPLPMVWVLLLALYLASYMVGYTDRGERGARFLAPALVGAAALAAWNYGFQHNVSDFMRELISSVAVLFLGGWAIHARLYRSRPGTEGLTRYYLMIVLGGAVGGAVCSFGMPLVVTTTAEYPVALALVLAVACLDARDWVLRRRGLAPAAAFRVRLWIFAGCALFAVFGICRGYVTEDGILRRYRNFYGLGRVAREHMEVQGGEDYWINALHSGDTLHGFQKVSGDWKGQMATAYYAEHAGGLAVVSHPGYGRGEPLRVAVCGMGIGTLATHARDGDFYRFYEINPAVVSIARDTRLFSFLQTARGTVDLVVDDARRALEREREDGEPKYDVIVVDVFSGDAIPPHMATREAVALYLDRLAPGGVLSFHLSNWHMDLLPLVKATAAEFGLRVAAFQCQPTEYAIMSLWAHFSRTDLPFPEDGPLRTAVGLEEVRDVRMMTDDYHPLVPYLSFSKIFGHLSRRTP